MVNFTLLILIGAIIGLQTGIYFVLRQKNIPSSRSFLFTFILYLIPLLIITAHIELYNNRHKHFKEFARRQKYGKERMVELSRILDTKKFFFISIIMTVTDLLTPKDNLILVINIAEVYNNRFTSVKRKSIMERFGALGIVRRVTEIIRGDFVTHASEQVFLSKTELKSS